MGMAVGGGGDAKRPAPAMNVTPLVDVTLVVLIIFMVITPLMTKTFWLNLPPQDEKEEKTPPPDQNEPLVMTIDKEGVIRVNKTKLERDEIATRLPRMLAAKRQKVLYFDASDDVEYAKAMEVLDLARQGGAHSIAILTKKVVK
jgi:biopolymer transport protein ExbD/biopolymer transport protein TolR